MNKMLLYVCLLTALTACLPNNSFSQERKAKNKFTMQFGTVGASEQVTPSQLLADTHIRCSDPDCKVTGFNISWLPTGGEYLGPYTINSDQLDDRAIKTIKKMDTVRMRIFIDDVHIVFNGKDTLIKTGCMLTCQP